MLLKIILKIIDNVSYIYIYIYIYDLPKIPMYTNDKYNEHFSESA